MNVLPLSLIARNLHLFRWSKIGWCIRND